MKNFVVSRLALLGSAAAFVLAACSSEKPVAELSGPSLTPRSVINAPSAPGVPTAGYVQVCIDGGSTVQLYRVLVTGGSAANGDVVTTPLNIAGPGGCGTALVRTTEVTPGSSSPVSAVTLTLDNSGTASYVCDYVVTSGTFDPTFCGAGPGNPAVPSGSGFVAVASANQFHGSTVTWSVETPTSGGEDPPLTGGCTYTQGWWKNRGAAAAGQFNFDGGTANGLTVLNTSPRGNPYYILAHQYITAALNIANGAGMPTDVFAAYTSAGTYFGVASAVAPLPTPWTKSSVTALATALDNYNNGVTGPGHCD